MDRTFRATLYAVGIVIAITIAWIGLHIQHRTRLEHQRTMSDLCTDARQFVVGIDTTGPTSAYVNACNYDSNHNLNITQSLVGYRKFVHRSDISPDGKLRLEVSGNQATFISQNSAQRFRVELVKPKSPMSWSPNSRFVLYIGEPSSLLSSLPLRDCQDSSLIIHIIDVQRQYGDIASKACAGFPYRSLGWLQR